MKRSTRSAASNGGAGEKSVDRKVTAPQLPELPHEMLCRIQQYVDLRHRLSSCSLVCKAWKQAADAVFPKSIELAVNQASRESTASLLSMHGSKLEALSLYKSSRRSGGTSDYVCLTMSFCSLSRLQSLSVAHLTLVSLGLGAAVAPSDAGTRTGTRPGTRKTAPAATAAAEAADRPQQLADDSLGCLTALTRLQLSCVLLDLRQLYKCTALKHLQLQHPIQRSIGRIWPIARDTFEEAITAALSHLTQLTHLTLSLEHSMAGILQGFTNLRQLRHLALHTGAGVLAVNPADLAHAHLSGLTHLELVEVALHNGETAPGPEGRRVYVEQVAMLPGALGRLRQLQHLELKGVMHIALTDAAMYSSLTAATQLTYLGLRNCLFPAEALGHIFKVDRKQEQLQHLVVRDLLLRQPRSFQRMVSCCPDLQQLKIAGRTGDPFAHVYHHAYADGPNGLGVLAQLTGLTKLALRCLRLTGGEMDEVGSITQLKQLDLKEASNLSGYGLHGLTQLTNLEYLRVITDDFHISDSDDNDSWSDSTDDEQREQNNRGSFFSYRVILHNRAPPGDHPDVSEQLQEFCKNDVSADSNDDSDSGSDGSSVS